MYYIGLAEASYCSGNFLQLTGAGFTYADFTWQATNNTYGAINKGQFFGNASDIIIVIQLQKRELSRWRHFTVTGVLTVSDQFAGSAYIQDASGAV
jgi:hypothetical protein